MRKKKAKAKKLPDKREYLSLSQAARLLPKPPAPVTLWRWATKGLKGPDGSVVRLRHVRFGSKIFTTMPWLNQFGDDFAEAHGRSGYDDEIPIPTKTKTKLIMAERGIF